MATTTSADLYAPEVWADVAQAQFTGKAVIATSPAVVEDDSLEGNPGDTVNFPKWMALGELDELSEGTPMSPEKLGQSNSKATIKEAGKAVEISDKAKLVGKGNAQDEAIRQFGALAGRKVDGDLIAAARATVTGGVTYADGTTATDSSPLTFTGGAGETLGWSMFANAVEAFGDDFEPSDFAGIYVRAEQRTELWTDSDFIKASELDGSVVRRGQIGDLGGVPVFVTNRLALGEWAVLKNGALGLMYKQRPVVEQDRDILARSTVVTTNLHYAVKRLLDEGVLVGTITPGV